MLRKIWHPFELVKFHESRSSIILAEFSDTNDKDHVLNDGPWLFDKFLVLVKEFDGSQQIQNVLITNTMFWVRVFDLPMMARNEHIGRVIGNAMGEFV